MQKTLKNEYRYLEVANAIEESQAMFGAVFVKLLAVGCRIVAIV